MSTVVGGHHLLPKNLELESLSVETAHVSIWAGSGARRTVCLTATGWRTLRTAAPTWPTPNHVDTDACEVEAIDTGHDSPHRQSNSELHRGVGREHHRRGSEHDQRHDPQAGQAQRKRHQGYGHRH